MNVGELAYRKLYPNRKSRTISVGYSKRFKPFNANVKFNRSRIDFSFSHHWEPVSRDIQVGLAQHLLLKVFRDKQTTLEIELYEKFMEKLPKYADGKNDAPQQLIESFNRVNSKYFNGYLSRPGLEWGRKSKRQLGLYTYATDTVRISRIFEDIDQEWMLDYVLYHELLHKKLGVRHENGSCRHHTPRFRELEARFDVEDADKKISRWVRNIFK